MVDELKVALSYMYYGRDLYQERPPDAVPTIYIYDNLPDSAREQLDRLLDSLTIDWAKVDYLIVHELMEYISDDVTIDWANLDIVKLFSCFKQNRRYKL